MKLSLFLIESLNDLTEEEFNILRTKIPNHLTSLKDIINWYKTVPGRQYVFANIIPGSRRFQGESPAKILTLYSFGIENYLKSFYDLLKARMFADGINYLNFLKNRVEWFASQDKCYSEESILQGGGYSVTEFQYGLFLASAELFNHEMSFRLKASLSIGSMIRRNMSYKKPLADDFCYLPN